MSGGHWNYSHHVLAETLETIARDEESIRRWPQLSVYLFHLSRALYDCIAEMDFDLSGDSMIENDQLFEYRALQHMDRPLLRDALRAVLLFHDGGEWTNDKSRDWLKITGSAEATTKQLCDHIRKVLE